MIVGPDLFGGVVAHPCDRKKVAKVGCEVAYSF
jgi:hypothetical protein